MNTRATVATALALVTISFSPPAAAQPATGKCGVDRRAIKTRHVSRAPGREYSMRVRFSAA